MAQAASRWLPDPGSGQVGFVVDKVALGRIFSEYFGFPCQSSFYQIPHYHNHPGQARSEAGIVDSNPTQGIDVWSIAPNGHKPSYWHSLGTEPMTHHTIGQLVDIAAERWGDKEALLSLYQDHRITFSEARDKADHLAAGLLQLGLSPGDRLAIWGPNSIQWYISRLAAARGGFIAVQIDPAYQAPELLHSLTKVGVKALISTESYKTSCSYQILRAVIPELDNCPESGDQLRCAKVPSLRSLVIMSNRQYR
ncbi:hypothetical protein B7P43_G12428 [Cryptotermes secundus]|uniref:AMP-dependent synthetase/ligase domain-containing protein n=1 Tax=Cryptotermes secundus TaxID=105785 RepID=A0A2J7PBW2_9NEOP|nr:hypothetical protein B7P43_G12428 [Cryptotermes secundus]